MELNSSISKKLWIIAVILLIITSIAVFFKIASSPDVIALRYNVIIGVDEVGNKYELIKLPLTGLLLGVLNFVLAHAQKFDRKFLPFLASLITVVLNALLLLSALLLFRVS